MSSQANKVNTSAPGVAHGPQGVDVRSDNRLFVYTTDMDNVGNLKAQGRPIWWVAITLACGIGWAATAEIDQVSRGQGAIISSQKTQVIQAPDGGVIEDLLVREGDVVTPDQVLAKLDQGKAGAAVAEVQAKRDSLQASVARLRAEVLGTSVSFPPSVQKNRELVDTQLRLYEKRRRALNEETDGLARSLALAQEELDLNRKLLKKGDVGKTEVIRLERQVSDIQAQITNRKNKYFQDAQAELAKAEEDLASIGETLNQRQTSLGYTVLSAPVGGTVKNVRFTTKGAVLRPGDELLTIVPNDDSLIIEAKIRPADIAFVRKGMEANVKIDSYDYTIYGSLQGRVIYISADTLTEETRQAPDQQTYYRVHVETKDRTFKNRPNENLDLIPGMTASVEVKSGKNTVLKYMLKPVIKTVNQSLGER